MKSMKRVLSAALMPVLILSMMVSTFAVSAAAATACSGSLMVVDDDLATKKAGSSATVTVAGVQYTGTVGKTAFATVQDAYKAVQAGGSIYVAPGVYSGDLQINKNVALYGNNADENPNVEGDVSTANSNRAITGANESILQNMAISYAELGLTDNADNTGSITLNGFAMAGDGCMYFMGERLFNTQIEISNNVIEFVNDKAYSRLGISESAFSAIKIGTASEYYLTMTTSILNNRILGVRSTGSGLSNCMGIVTTWTDSLEVSGNYIANTSGDAFAVSQPGAKTVVANNYCYNNEKARVYDGIKSTVEIYGNTFDSVGETTATGTYTLGVYSNADSTNYNNSWDVNTGKVAIYENTFKNSGKAIRLYAKLRANDKANNSSPYGCEIYDNLYIPANQSDCCFISFGYGDGLYNPKAYNNYTGGMNPKDISLLENCSAGAEIDFGQYWLDEAMTVSSEHLAVTKITNSDGVLFSSVKINAAPDYIITAAVAAIDSVKPVLEMAEGAYYELYADAKCTTPLPNDTLSLQTGANFAYAKVHFAEYSAVYTIVITKKVTYSTYLDANESVVSPEFAQYASGQTVYVELQGEWRRAVVGHSAFESIAEAVNNALSGDTIMVTAGVYEESITIAKGVKIKGAKAGINPNDMSSDTFERNPERSDLNEETVFTSQITLNSGINGLEVDGVTLTGGGFFRYNFTGHTTGLTLQNIILTANTTNYGLIYKARNDAGNSILTGFVVRQCRFENTSTSYVTCAGSIANSTFEGNVYYKTKSGNGHYIGGTNGGSNSVIAFKNNVWYGCTGTYLVQSADGSESSNPNARADSNFLFDGNRYIDCTSTYAARIQRWKSGLTLTIINNRLEGTTKSTFYAVPQVDCTGQQVVMHENYFGSSVSTALSNLLDTTADCSRNYYAGGIKPSTFSGSVSYSPYYADANMTILTGDTSIENVVAPEKATFDNDAATVTYSCDAAEDEVEFNLQVSEGATYKLYKDSACKEEITDNVVTLEGSKTVAYAKLTAGDGITSKLYTITITKPVNNKAELKGFENENSVLIQQGQNTYQCNLPSDAVYANITPITSSGAEGFVYAASDTEMKNPIDAESVAIPVGKTTYIIKVVSEDQKNTQIYTVSFRRDKSAAAELLAINGALDDMEVSGTDVTVYYPNQTTSVVPNVTVSDGATYKFYEQTGQNIEKTDAVSLKVGDNVIYLVITAEDGVTTKEYKLHLFRQDKSGENYILAESFESFAWNSASQAEGEYIGIKQISNFGVNDEYGMPYIYLFPTAYIESLQDELVVSKGATYDIFKKYEGGVLSGLVSSKNNVSKIALTEGTNNFFVRVTAENNESRIFNLRVYNFVKSTGNQILSIDNFSSKFNGNVITASGSAENAPVVLRLSENATAKVYADKKKTIALEATLTQKVDETTGESYTSCDLAASMQQPYIVYYVDVTSQVGKTASYTIQLTSGLFNATFSDVPDKHWASSYIQTAYSMGVTTGSLASDGSRVFKPSDNATRQEIAVFMCNLLGIDASAYSGQKLNYKDSKSVAKWAQNAVKAVTALGIMQGDNGNFKPSNSITRQEFMAVMVRAAALDTSLGKASTLNAFKDKNKVSSWAKVYVQTAVAYKLVNGDNGYLKPLDKITRAEIVKIMVCAKDFVR